MRAKIHCFEDGADGALLISALHEDGRGLELVWVEDLNDPGLQLALLNNQRLAQPHSVQVH
jgi:hypothetical protein